LDLIDKNVSVVQEQASQWRVSSESQHDVLYVIQKTLEQCDCKVRCASCGVCQHMYSCSCADFAVHSTACKHIHIINIKYGGQDQSKVTDANSVEMCDVRQHITQGNESSPSLSDSSQHDLLKQEFKGLVSQLQLVADESSDCNVLKAGITHLKSALGVMKSVTSAHNNEKLVPTISVAPNTNSQCQPRFYCTKKEGFQQMKD